MAKLTLDMKQAIETAVLYPLATASKSGEPNVVPIKFVFIENDEQLWLVDNFMAKTLENLQQNPRAALNIYAEQDTMVCFQVKGSASIHTSGDNYHRMKEQVHKVRPDAPAKSLIVLQIKEIYQCLPGATAGQRLN